MAKTTIDKPSASGEEALKRRKKQARQEAKLMLEIEEAKLAELRAPRLEPAMETPPDITELERQQEQAELESSIAQSNGKQQASPETGASTSTDEEQHAPSVEETTPSEALVVTNEVTEGSEAAVVQDNETATEPAPTPATPRRAPAQKTMATRNPAVTKRPTSPSTATKRPASRSQNTRQPHADAE